MKILIAEADILAHRQVVAGEILEDDADLPLLLLGIDIPQINTVDPYLPCGRIV